ncbi:hypothetical protein [Pseudomonas coleopterorum]|uniref:hypothetical protein n=1 Tax=Pseudomonas coleopterorum TaxID=1605838 RepID=UPI00178462A6|nr:hypothetical protein [Pseudomonas coleopterorum]MBD8483939.1 hypothetical protein [Pseudomonas coleopterorum]
MDKADLEKAAKGLKILVGNIFGPVLALFLWCVVWVIIAVIAVIFTVAMLLAIIDTGYLIHSGSHLDWMTEQQRYITYIASAMILVSVLFQEYKQNGSYIERLKKVVDDNEIKKQKNAVRDAARKKLADKGAFTDESLNTKKE